MFDSLDATIEALMRSGMPPGSEDQVAISFARPDTDFAATIPTLNFFLYKIAENRELRDRVPVTTLDNGSYTGALAPVRVDCHYLVSAWAASGQPNPEKTEHFLLGRALNLLFQHRVVPQNLLKGVMKRQPIPLQTAAIQGAAEPRGDFWLALGGKPRAVLDYKVIMCVMPGEPENLGAAVQSSVLKMGLRPDSSREPHVAKTSQESL